jgi:hypothetical protein
MLRHSPVERHRPVHTLFPKMDYAVWRPESGIKYILESNGAPGQYISTQWGLPTDIPVPADYDGNGRMDVAVLRPETGIWYIMPSGARGTYTALQWGLPADTPVEGDYDGDGKTDMQCGDRVQACGICFRAAARRELTQERSGDYPEMFQFRRSQVCCNENRTPAGLSTKIGRASPFLCILEYTA